MASRYEKFTNPYAHSQIPFLLAEVLTDGSGKMVDLVCRDANAAAASLLSTTPADLKNRRFCRSFPAERLEGLAPLGKVAFSGSAASVSYTTVRGQKLTVTCYQLMYGLIACLLDGPSPSGFKGQAVLPVPEQPGCTAVLEVGRGGVRCLAFSPGFSVLTGYPQRELLNRLAPDLSPLIVPEDWPELLQGLLDSARSGQTISRELRLLCAGGQERWVLLWAGPISGKDSGALFSASFLDIDLQKKLQFKLDAAQVELDSFRTQVRQLMDCLPGGWIVRLDSELQHPTLLHISGSFAELLHCSCQELSEEIGGDPLKVVLPADIPGLRATLKAALTSALPCRTVFRIQRRGGAPLRLSAVITAAPQENGDLLACGTCSDSTREQDVEATLQLHSSLMDLFLSRPGSLCLDYDPHTDVAKLTSIRSGRRQSRTVEDYRLSLSTSPLIHPDDRKAVLTALRRACSRPGKASCEYQARYVGENYCRYRLAFLSLADRTGAVVRVTGLASSLDSAAAVGRE